MKRVFVALLVGILGAATQAHAWGAKGHQIVSYVGSTVGGQTFFAANADGMRQLSTVPDRVWKNAKTKKGEAPNHWFQADAYVADLNKCNDILTFPKSYDAAVTKYGADVILRNGTAPWRIEQLYAMAVSDFKSGNTTAALQEAGAMSHYIGDLSQPLHVSENYDGQMTSQTGIHAWFETANINDENAIRTEVQKRTQALLANQKYLADASGDLTSLIKQEIIRALLKRDEVLANDTKYGRNSPEGQQVQLDLAEDRMADGAAVLSIVLGRLAKDAAISTNSQITVSDPDWITPDFTSSAAPRMTPFAAPIAVGDDDEDCQAI